MPSEFKEFSELQRAGKIHKKLKIRLGIFTAIATVLLGILVYDIVIENLSAFPVIGFASFGFILGFFFFTHMNKITWDEEKEVIQIGKFDKVSFVILAVYIGYRILVESFLKSHYENALMVSGFSLAVLFGGMLGRLIGMIWAISRVHRIANSK